jgi:hypothetical protein
VLFVFFLFRAIVTADLPCDIGHDGFWLSPGSARKGERLHLLWLDPKAQLHDENIVFHPGQKGQFVPTQRRPVEIKVIQPLASPKFQSGFLGLLQSPPFHLVFPVGFLHPGRNLD